MQVSLKTLKIDQKQGTNFEEMQGVVPWLKFATFLSPLFHSCLMVSKGKLIDNYAIDDGSGEV